MTDLAPLMQVFKTESAMNTGTVLTLPSGLTQTMAQDIAEKIPLDTTIHALAAILAKEVGQQLTAQSLRPADYQDMRDIPDSLIERVIEELAKKPDMFFNSFKDQLKLQG